MGNYNIAVIKGDGIGPEIIAQAAKALAKVGREFGHDFGLRYAKAGGEAIDATGSPLPEETVKICKSSDAALLGAVGGPKWDSLPGPLRPEQGILGLRKALGLYANLRPAVVFSQLADVSPLRADIVGGGIDVMVVRELTGGIYFGPRGTKSKSGPGGDDELLGILADRAEQEGHEGGYAFDIEQYSEDEIRRIGRVAFGLAMKRGRRVLSVDKSNVLDASRLWRRVMTELSGEYPSVELEHMYVDNAAMQLVRNPGRFDVLVTSNMFGDILSDEASQITGSIGMLPSASLGEGDFGLYEPIHGSSPAKTGKDLANPIATILSAAMLLRYSLSLASEADAVEGAVESYLSDGYRTMDLRPDGAAATGTEETGDLIAERISS